MSKILLVAGHGQGDPGANGGGYNERDTMRQLVDRIKKLIPNEVDVYDKSLDMFQQTRAGGGMYTTKYRNIIEFHMDAAGSSASGGHVIIYKGYKPDGLDNRLANAIKQRVGWIRPNGFDGRNNLLNLNVAAQRGISYRLLELGFITNANDRKKIISEMDKTAEAIAEAITGKKIGGNKVSENKLYVITGGFRKNGPDMNKVVNFLKKEGMDHKLIPSGNNVRIQVGTFPLVSPWRRKLEDFLGNNKFNYQVVNGKNLNAK